MKHIALFVAALLLSACSPKGQVTQEVTQEGQVRAEETPIPRVDGIRAFTHVENLVRIGSRAAGTPGATKATAYIARELAKLGVRADFQRFRDRTPAGEIEFVNLLAKITDNDRPVVLIGSHYDTKTGIEGFEGANDSGSSTGLLLELARAVKELPPTGVDVWLAFLDGEEARAQYSSGDGLHGSRHMAQWIVNEGLKSRIRAVVILDMVGDRSLSVTIPRNSSMELVSAVFIAARQNGVRESFSLYPYEVGDDHEPFLKAGIPAIDIIDFEYGSAPHRNDYWHTSADTLDKLSPESLELVGNVVLSYVFSAR